MMILLVITVIPGYLLGYASTNMCFTSMIETEDNWALTSCPTQDISLDLMTRVAPKFMEEE